MGFGVAFALTRFGLDIFEVLHGPSDYLTASSLVVVMLFTSLTEMPREDLRLWPFVGIVCGAALIGVAFGWLLTLPATARSSLTSVRPLVRDATGRWWARQRRWVQVVLIDLIFIAAPGTAVVALWLALVLASTGVSILTTIGYRAATKYLHEVIVKPKTCASLFDAEKRRALHLDPSLADKLTPGALCLQVEAKGFQAIRGRRVIATSEVIVLFDPDTGVVRTVPRKDAIVTTVSGL